MENSFRRFTWEEVGINLLAEGADAYTSATPFQFVPACQLSNNHEKDGFARVTLSCHLFY